MRKILAICDLEVAYATHFMEYMNNRRKIPFEVQAFSSLDKVKEAVEQVSIEILLISERALQNRENEVSAWDIQQVIVLGEGIQKEKQDEYPTVSKYQSSDSVIREVMAVYAAEKREDPAVSAIKKETKVIGVYSPVGRCQKTSFAITLGQFLAKERSALYLNMESCAGFEILFEKTYDRTLSDIIYYLRQKTNMMIHHISSAVCTIENLDYLPPVIFPQDLVSVTAEEWRQLLQILRQESPYEVIVLDIGDGVSDVYEVLELCDRIFVPEKSDVVSQAKLGQFETLLETCTGKDVVSKVVRLKLPYFAVTDTKTQYIKQLQWSEFGDYVKKLIRKEQL